jgi:hypothetical protein
MVLNVLRGLNERFQFMAQLITRQRPFRSFSDVRADLRLAELNMASPPTPPSALVASSPTKPAASAPPPSASAPRPPPQTTGGGSSGKDRGRRRRDGHGPGGSSPGSAGGPQWPSLLNPWTGSIPMWPGSTPGGARGPPRVGPPQAMLAGLSPPSPFYPAAPGAFYQAPSSPPPPPPLPWDTQSLANAFSTVALNPPPSPLGLGPRLRRLLSHHLQSWYGHFVPIFLLPLLHYCG